MPTNEGDGKIRNRYHSTPKSTIILCCLPLALFVTARHLVRSPGTPVPGSPSSFPHLHLLGFGFSSNPLPPVASTDPSSHSASHLLYLATKMISKTNWTLVIPFGCSDIANKNDQQAELLQFLLGSPTATPRQIASLLH